MARDDNIWFSWCFGHVVYNLCGRDWNQKTHVYEIEIAICECWKANTHGQKHEAILNSQELAQRSFWKWGNVGQEGMEVWEMRDRPISTTRWFFFYINYVVLWASIHHLNQLIFRLNFLLTCNWKELKNRKSIRFMSNGKSTTCCFDTMKV
jgi:hypothetical protein